MAGADRSGVVGRLVCVVRGSWNAGASAPNVAVRAATSASVSHRRVTTRNSSNDRCSAWGSTSGATSPNWSPTRGCVASRARSSACATPMWPLLNASPRPDTVSQATPSLRERLASAPDYRMFVLPVLLLVPATARSRWRRQWAPARRRSRCRSAPLEHRNPTDCNGRRVRTRPTRTTISKDDNMAFKHDQLPAWLATHAPGERLVSYTATGIRVHEHEGSSPLGDRQRAAMVKSLGLDAPYLGGTTFWALTDRQLVLGSRSAMRNRPKDLLRVGTTHRRDRVLVRQRSRRWQRVPPLRHGLRRRHVPLRLLGHRRTGANLEVIQRRPVRGSARRTRPTGRPG